MKGEIKLKFVYICSPLRGNIEENIKKANEYCRQEVLKGNCPLAPHCIFTQYLNDNILEERELGIKMGLNLLIRCDEILVCGNKITEGMAYEIEKALKLGIRIRSQELPMQEVYDSFFNKDEINNEFKMKI